MDYLNDEDLFDFSKVEELRRGINGLELRNTELAQEVAEAEHDAETLLACLKALCEKLYEDA